VNARGRCDTHYRQWWRQNPDKVTRRTYGETADERFWRQVEGGDVQTCWTWIGRPANAGYGKFVDGRKWYQAHRFAFERLIAEIPDGLELDHLCRNRVCVNPWHMEPVTHYVNTRRALLGKPFTGRRPAAVATHCANGHLRTEANTYISPNGHSRDCRDCGRERARRYKARRRAGKETS
jgi:hypothetical protein